jgi:PAS domain S-box-containing protein
MSDSADPRSENLFRLALEASPTGMLMVDSNGKIALVNAQIEAIFGYGREELIGMPVEDLVPMRFRGKHSAFRDAFFAAPQARAMGAGRDLYGLRKDGSEVPIEIGLNPLTTAAGHFVLSSILDITERRRALEQLRERTEALAASVKERDLLLQEVHHRVKNNLQLISSLINIQTRKLEAGAPRDVLAECKRRVEAISLIHEQLYQSRDYASVPFSQYATHLATNMAHASDASGTGIALHCECEPIALPVDKAISCGLILNELITNAMKHAFPEGRTGELRVLLHRTADGNVRLTVRDSGVGMSESPARVGSIGMQLVSTLTDQLNGKLSTEVANGTSITVEFPA